MKRTLLAVVLAATTWATAHAALELENAEEIVKRGEVLSTNEPRRYTVDTLVVNGVFRHNGEVYWCHVYLNAQSVTDDGWVHYRCWDDEIPDSVSKPQYECFLDD